MAKPKRINYVVYNRYDSNEDLWVDYVGTDLDKAKEAYKKSYAGILVNNAGSILDILLVDVLESEDVINALGKLVGRDSSDFTQEERDLIIGIDNKYGHGRTVIAHNDGELDWEDFAGEDDPDGDKVYDFYMDHANDDDDDLAKIFMDHMDTLVSFRI